MLLSVWIEAFVPLIPIYGENGTDRTNMALLQFQGWPAQKIAKTQEADFDATFSKNAVHLEISGEVVEYGADIFAGNCPAENTGSDKRAENHPGGFGSGHGYG